MGLLSRDPQRRQKIGGGLSDFTAAAIRRQRYQASDDAGRRLQRAQRARGQRIAQHDLVAPALHTIEELAQQAGLTDPGIAGDHDGTSLTGINLGEKAL